MYDNKTQLQYDVPFEPRVKQTDSLPHILKKIEKSKLIRGTKAFHRLIHKRREGKKLKGVLLIPFDYTPINQIIHLPVLCERNGISYIFLEKKKLTELTGLTSTCVFIRKKKEYLKKYKLFKTENNL